MNQTSHPPLLGPKSRQQQQPEVALEARHCAARIGLPTRHTTILILVAGCASAWLSSTSKPEERWFHSAGAAAAAGRPDPRRRLCYTFCTLSLSLSRLRVWLWPSILFYYRLVCISSPLWQLVTGRFCNEMCWKCRFVPLILHWPCELLQML